MRPRRPSNSLKEYPKEAEDARKSNQKRRGTLAQLLFGDKQTGKNNSAETNLESERTSSKEIRQPRSVLRRPRGAESIELMRPKILHVMVIGPKDSGKTTFLRSLAYGRIPSTSGNTPLISPMIEQQQNYSPTREDDTYHIQLHYINYPQQSNSSNITDSNIRQPPIELILFHDTVGIPPFGNIELKRAHLQVADAFLLVYSVTDPDSFNRIDAIKKQLEREKFGGGGKEKRSGGENVQIIVIGTKCDLPGRRRVDRQFALNWANQEKVKLFEISSSDRNSIVEVIRFLSSKFFNREPKFSLSRKLRPEKSNAQIVMDF